jgi:hypothetical protein
VLGINPILLPVCDLRRRMYQFRVTSVLALGQQALAAAATCPTIVRPTEGGGRCDPGFVDLFGVTRVSAWPIMVTMNVQSSDVPNPPDRPEVSPEPPVAVTAVTAIRKAVEQFCLVTGRQPDGVTGVRAVADGWSVLIDTVELERIPATTSILATYRVDVDKGGALVACERLRRYTRGMTDL